MFSSVSKSVTYKSELGVFSQCSDDFYYGVRCGILHQAETTGGWRIRRRGVLFDTQSKIINATRFHKELELFLQEYRETLKDLDWDGEEWQCVRRKMAAIIKHCRLEVE